MSKNLARFSIALAIVTLSTFVIFFEIDWSPQNHLPSGVSSFLTTADQFEIVSLDPEPVDMKREEGHPVNGPEFHRYVALGKTAIASGPKRQEIVQAIENGIAHHDAATKCFNPRHGIHAVKGDQRIDLVICFECRQIEVYREKVLERRLTNQTPRPVIDKCLTDAGVKLALKPGTEKPESSR